MRIMYKPKIKKLGSTQYLMDIADTDEAIYNFKVNLMDYYNQLVKDYKEFRNLDLTGAMFCVGKERILVGSARGGHYSNSYDYVPPTKKEIKIDLSSVSDGDLVMELINRGYKVSK